MKIFIATSLLFIQSYNLQAQDKDEIYIRILIATSNKQIQINTYGDVIIEDSSLRKFRLVPNASYVIKPDSENFLYLSKEKLSSPVKFYLPEGKNFLMINGKKYTGQLTAISRKNGYLNIVEELPFEKYLMGVLASEMGPNWPLEALKAQAVASRTYAARLIKKQGDYDIGSDVTHQVYSGLEKINDKIFKAVNETRGEVLYYNGRMITAFFHACCGGRTTTPSSAFSGGIIKPLKGIVDPYCKFSNHYEWNISLHQDDLLSFIQKNGSTALKLKSVKIHSKDKSGRAVKIAFMTDKGSFKIDAKQLRKEFGTFEFKSTFITKIEKRSKEYIFYARGWGHGVGMCQEGAKFMAQQKGFSYKKILTFYYPGAKITDIKKFFQNQ